jgi:hypothetical protein
MVVQADAGLGSGRRISETRKNYPSRINAELIYYNPA